MANVIRFPAPARAEAGRAAPVAAPTPKRVKGPTLAGAIEVVWIVTALFWPLLKWVVALDCLYQLVRALYYSGTPGVHAWWTFALHFAVLTALTYFVGVYKPKPA